MDPDLDVLSVQEHIQPASMIEMEMSNDDLLDVFEFVSCSFDRGLELMLRLIPDAGEDVGDDGAPDFGIVFAASGLPQDETLVRVFNQDAVHGQLSALVHK